MTLLLKKIINCIIFLLVNTKNGVRTPEKGCNNLINKKLTGLSVFSFFGHDFPSP